VFDRFSQPPTQQDRQPLALFAEPLLPRRVIFDDANRHIDHCRSV
jgi:hypothetical protein